jgi:hypothetical protein
MKKCVFSIVMLFALSQFAAAADKEVAEKEAKAGKEAAAPTEKTLLVKVTDRSERVTFELMAPADFKQLQTQLALEEKFHVKAMAATEKAWREDESTKKKSFPRSAIAIRKAEKIAEFTDAGKASDALAKKDKAEGDRLKAEADKAAKREKDIVAKKSKTQEQLDKEKKRDAERESIMSDARNLYESKLQELMAPAEAAAEPAKEEPKKDAKKEEPKEAAKKGK